MTTSPLQAAQVRGIDTADVGLFGPSSVTWRIHEDPSMLLGGLRSLLLQALHPLALAGFDANSSYRVDPWGRLRRTGEWVATVTYGTTDEAETAGRRLRALHARLAPGVEPETRLPYRVDDPDLLLWVHCTEVESFLSTFRRSGGRLTDVEADAYVAEMRTSAALVGLDRGVAPATVAGIEGYFQRIRPQLRVTALARRNLGWGFVPPMPTWVSLATPARPTWASVVGVALALLPPWARRMYGLPGLPASDLAAALAARAIRRSLLLIPGRWTDSPARRDARQRLGSCKEGEDVGLQYGRAGLAAAAAALPAGERRDVGL